MSPFVRLKREWWKRRVITDDPTLLNRVMAERAELSSPERLLLEAAFWMGMVPKDPKAEADLDPEALSAIGSR